MFNLSLNILFKFFVLIIFQILILNISNINSENVSLINLAKNISGNSNITSKFNSSDFEPKIVNGVPAVLKGNEHMVSIRLVPLENEKPGSGHFCGGSLIARHMVLTAAHCLIVPKSDKLWPIEYLVVVMGSLHLNDTINSHKREVNRTVVHKKYNEYLQNDIGLIFLQTPFTLSDKIKVIKFAEKADYQVDQKVQLSGWGAVVADGEASPIMMTTDVKIVSQDVCRKAYADFNNIINTMFCAADGNKDSCQGDSGGPLVMKNIQYGVVSWGKGCGIEGYPGVYTDVASYSEWIKTGSGNKMIIHSATFLSIFVAYFLAA